jgi:phage-related protein
MLPTLISEISSVLLDNLGLIISTGIDLLIALITGISEATPQLIDLLPQIISQIQMTIFNNLPLIIEAGLRLLEAMISGIMTALPSLLSLSFRLPLQVADNIRKNMPQILATGKQILTSLVSGISSMIGNLRSKAGQVFNTVKNKFAQLPNALINIGKDLVRGLWNGINDMTSWVINKIQGFGESVLSGIRDFFGINSPSKLFEDEVGKYLAEGIGVGFTDEMRNVTAEMQDALPTSFDVGTNINSSGLSATGGADYYTLVNAFKTALGDMTVELDDITVGKFVRKTVTDAIYT